MSRHIDVARQQAADDLPGDEPLEEWTLGAVGPEWAPPPGARELLPVPGRLMLHAEALVFYADPTVTSLANEPVVASIPAASILDAGPLSPGSRITPSELAGTWMPRWMRRFVCPGFVVRTTQGDWAFDSRRGQGRARSIRRRYVQGAGG